MQRLIEWYSEVHKQGHRTTGQCVEPWDFLADRAHAHSPCSLTCAAPRYVPICWLLSHSKMVSVIARGVSCETSSVRQVAPPNQTTFKVGARPRSGGGGRRCSNMAFRRFDSILVLVTYTCVYIYIYIERERDVLTYIYIYIYRERERLDARRRPRR